MHKPQKYQNKLAFKLRYHKDKEDLREKAPLNNLCGRCHDIISWKLHFGKYKKMTTLGKCLQCQQKVVRKSYRVVCDNCSSAKKVCSKCNQPAESFRDAPHKAAPGHVDADKLQAMKVVMATFKERSRRKILRLVSDNNVDFVDNRFLHKDTGAPVEVHIKNSDKLSEESADGEEQPPSESEGELQDSEGSYNL